MKTTIVLGVALAFLLAACKPVEPPKAAAVPAPVVVAAAPVVVEPPKALSVQQPTVVTPPVKKSKDKSGKTSKGVTKSAGTKDAAKLEAAAYKKAYKNAAKANFDMGYNKWKTGPGPLPVF
jgi:hypothetical protein